MGLGVWREATRLAELPPSSVRRVELGGCALALLNAGGVVYAVNAACPHQGGPLDAGQVREGQIECPWHHFRYDLRTGANVYPANVYPLDLPRLQTQLTPLRVFPVRIEDGHIIVCVEEFGAASAVPTTRPGGPEAQPSEASEPARA